jgi:hypothetical protein
MLKSDEGHDVVVGRPFERTEAGSIGQSDSFSAGASGEGREQRSSRVGEEVNGAIGEEEIGPARMKAPHMIAVTRIVEPARPENNYGGIRVFHVAEGRHGKKLVRSRIAPAVPESGL